LKRKRRWRKRKGGHRRGRLEMANRMESVRLERRGSMGDIEGKVKRKWELLEKEAEGGRKEEEEGVFKKSNKITRSPEGGRRRAM